MTIALPVLTLLMTTSLTAASLPDEAQAVLSRLAEETAERKQRAVDQLRSAQDAETRRGNLEGALAIRGYADTLERGIPRPMVVPDPPASAVAGGTEPRSALPAWEPGDIDIQAIPGAYQHEATGDTCRLHGDGSLRLESGATVLGGTWVFYDGFRVALQMEGRRVIRLERALNGDLVEPLLGHRWVRQGAESVTTSVPADIQSQQDGGTEP